MADEPQTGAGDHPLSAEEVASSTFPTAFRGFDPVEVRAFLARLADELRAGAEREAELRAALDAVPAGASYESQAEMQAQLEAAHRESQRVTAELRTAEASLADQQARLGEQDAMLAEQQAKLADREDRARLRDADAAEQADHALATARDTAARIVTEAKETSTQVVREAREEAARLTSDADRILAEAKEAAAASGIEERREAERDAAVIRVKAREEADAIIEAAKERGREMVGEAQAARERMLKDLAKRRRAAQAQLEHLKESRDRVLEHLRLARRAVDDITTRFEPVEAGRETTAVPSATSAASPLARPLDRPSVDQPQTAAPAPPAAPAPSSSAAAADIEGTGPGPPPAEPPGEEEVADASGDDDVRPAAREERRSSALRILRRGRSSQTDSHSQPEHARADAAVEGVRIIGPPPRVTPTEPPPGSGFAPQPGADAPVDAPVEAPEEAPEQASEVWPAEDTEPLEPAASGLATPSAADEDPAPPDEDTASVDEAPADEAPADEADEPDGEADDEREPVRPGETLDELFARLRAGREDAIAEVRNQDAPEATERQDRDVRAETETPISDADELALQRRDVAVEEAEATMVRRLKRSTQDEQNAVLDALRTFRGQPTTETLLGPPEVQQQRFRRLASGILGQSASAGAGSELAPPPVDDLVDAFAREVTEALRDRIERALAQAHEEGLDATALAERFNAIYRDFKSQRAERIGGHFVIAAHARGAFAGVVEGTAMRWVVDDGGPCPDCDDNALAGPVPKGAAYPTGQLHPPAHVGCRCLLVPATGT